MNTGHVANTVKFTESGIEFLVMSFHGYFTAQFYTVPLMDYYNELLEDMTFITIDAAKAYCIKSINMTMESAYCQKYDL